MTATADTILAAYAESEDKMRQEIERLNAQVAKYERVAQVAIGAFHEIADGSECPAAVQDAKAALARIGDIEAAA